MNICNLYDFRDAEAAVWSTPGVGYLYGEFRRALFATKVRLHNIVAGNTQRAVNDALKDVLRNLGWQEWVPNPALPNNKSDFRKESPQNSLFAVGAEVQMSNVAKVSDDLTKLNYGIVNKKIDVALLVIPSREMARLMDSNLPTFDRVVRELNEKRDQFPRLSVLVIEVAHDGLVGIAPPQERGRPASGRGYAEDKRQPDIEVDDRILAASP